MSWLARVALALNNWTARWVPSALSIVVLFTLLALFLSTVATDSTLLDSIRYWGNGFWELLTFAMQMTLIMVTGYIVVISPVVTRVIQWFARIPKSAAAAIGFTAFGSMMLALINWGLGILGSAVLVKYMAKQNRDVDYRLLVATAYFGLGCTWHAGLSASAPILVATPKHFMEAEIGIIPLSLTIFHPFNLVLTIIVVVLMTAIAVLMHPRKLEDRKTVDPEKLAEVGVFAPPAKGENEKGLAAYLDYRYLLNGVIGLLGLIWLIDNFLAGGWERISINTVNFFFLTAGILLHPSPASVLKAAGQSASYIYNIVLQFPFYSGIYGIIKGSGLSEAFGNLFVRIADERTLPLVIYWYSGIVNYFIPSGGSKWAVEAPYVLEAAKTLSVGYPQIVVSYAWGDMMTDLLQPFWAIPLLTAAGIEFREILGYEMIAFLFYALLVSVFFYFMPFYG